MSATTARGLATRGKTLSRAIAALGAPRGGRTLLSDGDAALSRALNADLGCRVLEDVAIESLDAQPSSAFDLVVIANGCEAGGLGQVRQRLITAKRLLALGGSLVLYLPTLAAPVSADEAEGPVSPYDLLLFPEAAAAGDLGAALAQRAPLAASTWLSLFHSLDLGVVAQAGLGAYRFPPETLNDHQSRLAVFDLLELATGRLLVILQVREGAS